PATHNETIANGACSCSATRPGVRRIPTPIVPPILTAKPKPTPRTRRRLPDFWDTITVVSVNLLHARVSLNLFLLRVAREQSLSLIWLAATLTFTALRSEEH